MNRKILLLFVVVPLIFKFTKPQTASYDEQHITQPKYNNPGYVKDRLKNNDKLFRPTMNDEWEGRFRQKFDPMWQDYCDPWHCNDYHKTACGVNRASMKFKWFQSGCHIALHNFCYYYRGSIKYDMVDAKWCTVYVMYTRSGCPQQCSEDQDSVCAASTVDNHIVLFKNQCYMEMANCRNTSLNEYDEVTPEICKSAYKISKLKKKEELKLTLNKLNIQ